MYGASATPINEYPIPVVVGGTGVAYSTGSGNNVLSKDAVLEGPDVNNGTFTNLTGTNLIVSDTSGGTVLGANNQKQIVSLGSTGIGPVVRADGAAMTNVSFANLGIGVATGTSLNLTSLTPNRVLAVDATKNIVSNPALTPGDIVTVDGAGFLETASPNATGTGLIVRQDNASMQSATLINPFLSVPPPNKVCGTDALNVLGEYPSTGTGDVVLADSPVFTSQINLTNNVDTSTLITVGGGEVRHKMVEAGTNLVITNHLDGAVLQVNGGGGEIFIPSGTVSADRVMALDGSKQLIDAPFTGTGTTVVMDDGPTIQNLNLAGDVTTPLPINEAVVTDGAGKLATLAFTGSGNLVAKGTDPVFKDSIFLTNTTDTSADITIGSNELKVQLVETGTNLVIADDADSPLLEVRGAGEIFIQSATVSADKIMALNGSKQLVDSPSTGLGTTVVMNDGPTINNPDLDGNILTDLTPNEAVVTDGAGILTTLSFTGSGNLVAKGTDPVIKDSIFLTNTIDTSADITIGSQELKVQLVESATNFVIADDADSPLVEVRGAGDIFLPTTSLTASTVLAVDAFKQVYSSLQTGAGAVIVMDDGPNIKTPTVEDSILLTNTIDTSADITIGSNELKVQLVEAATNFVITNHLDGPIFKVNGGGGEIFIPSGTVSANKIMALDGSKQLIDSPATGTGTTVVMSESPIIASPSFTSVPGYAAFRNLQLDGGLNLVASTANPFETWYPSAGSFTYNPPANALYLEVTTTGGGGGGAYTSTGLNSGSGGAGGNSNFAILPQPLAASYDVLVGAGGVKSAVVLNSIAGQGGVSSFTITSGAQLVFSEGGYGGRNSTDPVIDTDPNIPGYSHPGTGQSFQIYQGGVGGLGLSSAWHPGGNGGSSLHTGETFPLGPGARVGGGGSGGVTPKDGAPGGVNIKAYF